jgi:Rps23 Pro-64 3,4-dihydroxylase Tpa1-like proline 4-hydroxylase
MKQEQFKQLANSLSEKILMTTKNSTFSETPFKHCVIDDFFDNSLANELLDSFPPLNDEIWEKTNDKDIEVKYRTNFQSEFDVPDGLIKAFRIFNSSIFLKAISKVFGIPKLLPDPFYSGGGLNVTEKGGLLDVHVDGNYHDASGLNRRINVILYLNPGWQKGWGGEFGLYNDNGTELIKKVEPIFNRLVIFDTHDKSFHGLPDPLDFPDGKNRKSIILYYYTKEEKPSGLNIYKDPHSALWVKKNITDKKGNKSRDFS